MIDNDDIKRIAEERIKAGDTDVLAHAVPGLIAQINGSRREVRWEASRAVSALFDVLVYDQHNRRWVTPDVSSMLCSNNEATVALAEMLNARLKERKAEMQESKQ